RAEDGLRGFHVTGVQTCALPIYALLHRGLGDGASRPRSRIPPVVLGDRDVQERSVAAGGRREGARRSTADRDRRALSGAGTVSHIGRASCRTGGPAGTAGEWVTE